MLNNPVTRLIKDNSYIWRPPVWFQDMGRFQKHFRGVPSQLDKYIYNKATREKKIL
jgi:hypothetical protein